MVTSRAAIVFAVLGFALGPGAGVEVAAAAPIGTAFTYQGRLSDTGQSANGPYDFEFRLFDDPATGSQIGPTVPRGDLAVIAGLFATVLDFGAVFDGNARYLEIAVRQGASSGSYTTLIGRQALTPSPYALHATNALVAPWSGLSGVPAGFADGVDNDSGAGASWGLSGNAGAGHFLGSTDNQSVDLRVNNARALRLEPQAASPNLVGGNAGNTVTAGAGGAAIGGGGAAGSENRVTDDYGTLAGGRGNRAGDNAGTTADKPYAAVGGGFGNVASGAYATIPGGRSNVASGDHSFAAGWGASAVNNGAFVWVCEDCPATASTAENQFVVMALGGVGIGTNTPAAGTLLDIAGKARMTSLQLTTGAALGRVLASDASGNAAWQAGSPPSGAAGGDLTGTYPNPTVAANAIASAEITDRQIQAIDIANGAITANELAINSVDTGQIALGAVNSSDILDLTISATDIANTTVTAGKLSATGSSAGQVLASVGGVVTWAAQANAPCALTCAGNVQTVSFLNAAGSCVTSFRIPCFPYGCDVSNLCRNSCSSDSHCSVGAWCDVAAAACATVGYYCSDGFTVKGTNGSLHSCGRYTCHAGACRSVCSTNGDCAAGFACSSGLCI